MEQQRHNWLDGAAVTASALCLFHCLALPVLIAALPALAQSLDLGEGVHAAMLAIAVPTSGLALLAGYRRHGAIVPIVSGTAGLILLAGGLIALRPPTELLLTVAGSLLLAAAHVANWRLGKLAFVNADPG